MSPQAVLARVGGSGGVAFVHLPTGSVMQYAVYENTFVRDVFQLACRALRLDESAYFGLCRRRPGGAAAVAVVAACGVNVVREAAVVLSLVLV